MNCPELTEQVFIAQFPEFEDAEHIEVMINRALIYISPYKSCFKGVQWQYAVFLLAAHLLANQDAIANGDSSGGIQTGASIDKVSVSIAPPPFTDSWEYWLNQTRYGAELLALFNTKMATPGYYWGSLQRVL